MALIFICYRREDASGQVGRIFDRLADSFGEREIFYDKSSIDAGTKWTKKINRELRDCKVFLAVIGKHWLQERLNDPEDYVRREIAFALEHDTFIVPVLVDSAKMPDATGLPTDITGLLQQQAFSLNDDSHTAYLSDVKGLTAIIEERLREPDGEPTLLEYCNQSFEILVDPEIAMKEKQIPLDSEVVISEAGGQILGIDIRHRIYFDGTWKVFHKNLPEEFKDTLSDELTQRILAVCNCHFVEPAIHRVRSKTDGCLYMLVLYKIRRELEGKMSFEILLIKDCLSD